ncbi:MAG: hypothetical protein ACEQSA_00225 [Weeksellaceae bacterium]
MTRKRLPYIFLTILFIIICFIAGVQYGKNVEKTNKAIKYILSITPSPQLTVTPAPSITYNEILLDGCAISFTLPSDYDQKTMSSREAQFTTKSTKRTLAISCTNIPYSADSKKQATIAAEIAGKSITGIYNKETNSTKIIVRHPNTGSYIQLSVPVELLPLVSQTFTFE